MADDDEDVLGVGLADAIGQVRRELERAIKEGGQSTVAFRPGQVELEFEIGFTRTGGIGGGFQLSVLALGAKQERSSASTHRIRVTLAPVDRQGGDTLIADAGQRDTRMR